MAAKNGWQEDLEREYGTGSWATPGDGIVPVTTQKSSTTPSPITGTQATSVNPLGDNTVTRRTIYNPITTYHAHDYLSDQGGLPENDSLALAEQGRPGPYQGRYDDQIQQLLGDILGRGEFKYDFNADPLYHQYAENYTQKGKLAAMDTLGQASAMTGGYGSTYGNQVAQQTYNQYMQDLSNQIPNLYQLAEQTWLNNGNEKRSNMGILEGLDNSDYGKYRDTVGDWEKDRAYNYTKYRDAVGDLQFKAQYYAAHPDIDPQGTKTVAYQKISDVVNKYLNYFDKNTGKFDIIAAGGDTEPLVGVKLSKDDIDEINASMPDSIRVTKNEIGNVEIRLNPESDYAKTIRY